MASKLNSVLGNMATPGMERLRGVKGMDYRAATIQAEQPRASLLDSIGRFAKAGADMYMAKDERDKQRADERSNEIIRKLTPEQRRQAIQNGTLLYQDDPYAMQALKFKTGRNAAFLVDDEVQQAIKEGRFRTREELEQYRHSRLQEQSKSFAEQFGINEMDEEYQKGFNANITERNIALYGAHDTFLSDQAQKGAILNSKVELNGVLSDPDLLSSPESGEFFQNYIDNSLVTGMTDNQAQQVISSSLNDVLQRPGGAAFLQNIENRKVTLNGATTTYRELMGDEQWQAMMIKAQHTQFQNNAKLTEKFRLDINSALNQADTGKGWEMLQGIKAELDKIQPGEELTPERQQLIEAQEHMQTRFKQEAAETAKLMDKQQKTINKSLVIDKQFQKRINGEYVSTDYKDMPTNENTGEFVHSDMVNYANQKLAQIDAMDIPEAQKDRMKLQYLQADSKDGAFRTAVGQLVSDARGEWKAAVINGDMPDSTPALDSLRKMRNIDPGLFAALYPDDAELFHTMDQLDRQGIKPQALINATKSRQGKTREMQIEDERAFSELMNNSAQPELKYLPASMREYAQIIYDSEKYLTGNPKDAMAAVSSFLKDTTYTFSSDNVDGGTYGVIPRNMMQVTDDPKSWEQGKDIIEQAVKKYQEQNPWVTNKQLKVSQQGNLIKIYDTTTNLGISYDNTLLRKVYKNYAEQQAAAAEKKALAEANKRAPIVAATKARKEAAKRVQEKRNKVPKFIYGRKED
ncbi:internal virion protein C [Salmonella phage vB_SAg-RPN15]|uniref:internal virion protein n=1 Tax=Salmonella phage vB_SAg-RPN15 TaxID=2910948 RepID=UPI0023290590|nr:internal virion protein [Salmonella phage vB_SAg-RPN15]UJD21502.1 internal virion protein C [Salmonella phage vB_SAg-RPN15]